MGLTADTIIPEPGNPQALNRYSYVLNNPLKYTDPTGHAAEANGGGSDLYAWARLLANTPSDKFHGWLHERDSAWAQYLIAVHEGAPLAVLEAATGSLEAKQSALLLNGYQGQDAAMQHAFTSFVGDAGMTAMAAIAGSSRIGAAGLSLGAKSEKYITDRGWTRDSIRELLDDPAFTRKNPDIINKATKNPVTYYYRSDGYYVIIDDVTGSLVQVADTKNPNWIDPMTNMPVVPIGEQ